jgi:hypothetical protein
MGTSRSFRSPATPRWHAVLAQIANDEPHELIQAELFNAGLLDGWNAELGRPGISVYVEALVAAHGQLATQLGEAHRPEEAIESLVAATRDRALREDDAPALALAERALTRTLISTARAGVSLAECEPAQAAAAWDDARGSPAGLVQRFLGEVLHQFASHVIARDAGQIVGRGSYESVQAVRALERSLAHQARAVSDEVDVSGHPAELSGRWSRFVDDAFHRASTHRAGSDG